MKILVSWKTLKNWTRTDLGEIQIIKCSSVFKEQNPWTETTYKLISNNRRAVGFGGSELGYRDARTGGGQRWRSGGEGVKRLGVVGVGLWESWTRGVCKSLVCRRVDVRIVGGQAGKIKNRLSHPKLPFQNIFEKSHYWRRVRRKSLRAARPPKATSR